MVAAAATGLEPHMKDDGDGAGDGAGDGDLTLIVENWLQRMFLCCPSSLVSNSKATFSKTSGVCSFHNTEMIDDDLVVVL